jgi:hypothetical protein
VSPSHTVGLELCNGMLIRSSTVDRIESPSHTVGLELKILRLPFRQVWSRTMSPSHTVGLERYQDWSSFAQCPNKRSPSHTVGLELKPSSRLALCHKLVRDASPSHTVGLEQSVIKIGYFAVSEL